LTGYDISIEDLKKFRQLHSKTPGHPENFATPGVEVSTGPLGQGISNAVGMAMTERHLAATFNKEGHNIVDHFTYVICGDGCLQEGISSEASSLAGHLGLGKLIVCYDDNGITIDGHTDISFTEDVAKRYEAYGWQVIVVEDVNDVAALRAAITEARSDLSRPSMIKIRTVIGYGSKKEGSHEVHGAPLGAADLSSVKEKFGFDPSKSFEVSAEVRDVYKRVQDKGLSAEDSWIRAFSSYQQAFPELAAEFTRRMNGQLPANWKDKLPKYSHTEAKAAATRNRSEEVLNAIATVMPEIVGGSADLTPSNLTALKGSGDFQKATPGGRYIRFGVREHGMAAICNGMMAHGGVRPFCATFLNFIGYALGAVRVSALSQFGIIYIMTHDSVGLGEDGPTHQPIEIMDCLRGMPNMLAFRPCDGNETVGAYVQAVERSGTPTVIALSRQACPTLEGSSADKCAFGGYVLQEIGASAAKTRPDLILVSSGTEVSLARDTALSVSAQNANLWVRVVSMPCTNLFDQSIEYQMSVFSDGSPVMSIEPSCTLGWRRYAHATFGLDRFGLSAPAGDIYKFFGFSVANLSQKCLEVVAFYPSSDGVHATSAPSLLRRPIFPVISSHH